MPRSNLFMRKTLFLFKSIKFMENLNCFLLKFVGELAKVELGVKITTLIEFMVSFVDINTS